jgi:tetrapyrrole methylase family protein / MazG family protein
MMAVVARLRAKDGCPWDREQTLDSLKRYLIEECYELLDAVDSGDPERHRDELGDVLLQVALHSQIRSEEKLFGLDDVADTLAEKLVRRHPHVFGTAKAEDAAAVLRNWEIIKAGEKKGERRSVLAGVPRHLPALQRAQRIQSRAARVGFDWNRTDEVMEKVEEELAELRRAMRGGKAHRVKEELGDLLFTLVNLSRFQKIEAEDALELTIRKFHERFAYVEEAVHRSGRKMTDCTLAELDSYWNQAKKRRISRRP